MVAITKQFRKQLEVYAKEGFTVKHLETAKGAHYKVWFNEFSEPQHLSTHIGEPRALKNNIARFKRLARGVDGG